MVPSHDLVVAVTAQGEAQEVFDALWECLLPGIDDAAGRQDDDVLARATAGAGAPAPGRSGRTRGRRRGEGRRRSREPALPDGTTVTVRPADGGWLVRLGSIDVDVGHGEWRESSPLGRPVVASGAWQGDTFVADLYVITTPHRVRLVVDATAGTAVAHWSTVPLTGPDLAFHLRSPLMTRPHHA